MATRIGSVCTGYGGLDMAARAVFGGNLAWWSDIEPGPLAVMARHHPDVPNIGDIRAADWRSVPPVDIFTAGYPCQPFSNAGKRLGTDDPRHLWPDIAHALSVLRPPVVILENVAAHIRRGFDIVTEDLAALGYDTMWTVIRASDIGAPHRRERLFILATHATGHRRDPRKPEFTGQSDERSQPDMRGSHTTADTGRSLAHPVGARFEMFQSVTTEPAFSHAGRNHRPIADAVRGGRGRVTHDARQRPVERTVASGDSPERVERWGIYAPAITRWETLIGWPAPEPTVIGIRGGRMLSPYLVEWMMGLPQGYVTATPGLSRNVLLRTLGNGVVPPQAEYALRHLVTMAALQPAPSADLGYIARRLHGRAALTLSAYVGTSS